MSDLRNVRKERPSRGARKEGSKDSNILCKEHVALGTFSLEGYQSAMDEEDLSLIWMAYCVLKDFELEPPSLDARIDNPLLSQLGIYEEAFEVGLRFSLHQFIPEFLRSCRDLLCILTPKFVRHIVGFLVVYFLAEIQPTFSLFLAFFTTQ